MQPAIWPQREISTEVPAHFFLTGPVGLKLDESGAEFGPGGYLATSPYYNIFNLGKWSRHAGRMPLQLQLEGQGRFLLSVRLASPNKSEQQLISEEIQLHGTLRRAVDLGETVPREALVFFELTALADARLDDFAWVTTAAPLRQPNLVLSVTTFRREAQVAAAAARFRAFFANSDLAANVRMVIVDNGQSCDVSGGRGVTVIPNANLGGAGGFARGLLEAKHSGATHCLFMDDDAMIQMEAIERTWWFLAYAEDPSTAVAGAVVDASHRWRLGENGARFELGCHPLYAGLDMRDRGMVFGMEFESTWQEADDLYGGWWFFAFPVASVDAMPFPFFVRGDDVSFSLANDFRIVTLPGIASVQEGFTDKASPQTWYLDFRSHLAHHLSLPQKERSWREVARMVRSFYVRTVMRFHYDSLAAVNLALEDVMASPRFFDENADMAQRRDLLKRSSIMETWLPIRSTVPRERESHLGRRGRKLMRWTLNGHLLPLGTGTGSDLVLPSGRREDYVATYGARQVTYLNADETQSYMVIRDRERFWTETRRLIKNVLRLRRIYPRLLREWRNGYELMTTDKYWQEKLQVQTPRRLKFTSDSVIVPANDPQVKSA
ncbi:MAG: hypothetical protein ACTIJJ_02515 [Galactobacter sp.]